MADDTTQAGSGCRGVSPGGGGQGLPAQVCRVLVVGASRSGISSALALRRLGREVTLSDTKVQDRLPELRGALQAGATFVGQDDAASLLEQVDLVIKSPGVPGEADLIVRARRLGVPVWSEVELAYHLFPNPFDAVTGTNGKTTTTALLGHLFREAGRPVRVLGNIGTAVTSVAGELTGEEELVVELSSFQLEDVHEFRPAVGIFLNLTQDHLDRHGDMQRYLACKAAMFARQGPGDAAVLNLVDPAVAALGVSLRERDPGPRVTFFSNVGREVAGLRADSWLEGEVLRLLGEPGPATGELKLRGLHNMENCLAAGTAALVRGLDLEAVSSGLCSFAGVAHRLEPAGTVAGVTYVNDSKATNVEATLKALGAYPLRTHLIAGGRDKASDFRPLARACRGTCTGVYLIGEASPLIAGAFSEVRAAEGSEGLPEPKEYGDMESAVRSASRAARPGDVVLLAPACASFDQYENFEERGEHFKTIVRSLARER